MHGDALGIRPISENAFRLLKSKLSSETKTWSELTKDVDLNQTLGHSLQQFIQLPRLGNELGLDVLDTELLGLASTIIGPSSWLLVLLGAFHRVWLANHAQKRAKRENAVLCLEDGEKVLDKMVAQADEALADRLVRRCLTSTDLVACAQQAGLEDPRQPHVTDELGHPLVVQGDQLEQLAEVLSLTLVDEEVDVEAGRALLELLVTLGHLVDHILVQDVFET